MKFYLTYLLIFSFVFSTQAQHFNFKNYSTKEGLTNNNVLGIIQMPNGEIWLGSNDGGINIFNGVNFKHLSKEDGLADNVVYSFTPDQKGGYWICTNHGVSYYFKNKISTPPLTDTAVNERFYTAFIEKSGRVLFGTAKGLAILGDSGIVKLTYNNESLDNANIINIREDYQGRLWLATLNNSVIRINTDGSLFHLSNSQNLRYTYDIYFPDEESTWIMTYKGLFEYKNDSLTALDLISQSNKNFTYASYHHCLKDSKGNFWFSTNRGIIKYYNGQVKLITPENGLVGERAWRVYEDREQNLWIPTLESGLSKLTSETFELTSTSFGLIQNDVQALLCDQAGKVWIGTKDGVQKLEDNAPIKLETFNKSSSAKEIYDFIEDPSGNIYAVSLAGVHKIKDNKSELISLKNESYYFKGYTGAYHNGKIVLGGIQGLGIINGDYIELINDSLNFPVIPVFDILSAKNGNLWFATDNGLILRDGTSTTRFGKSQGIPENKVRCLLEDNKGRIWIGSSEGLYMYENNEIKAIKHPKLPTDLTIYSMCFDTRGNLWLGQNEGLDQVKLSDAKIIDVKHYNHSKGFMAENCHNNAITLDSEGKILIGTNRGLLTYFKNSDFENSTQSILHFEDIQLFSQPTDWSVYCDSLDIYKLPVYPILNHNQNYFSFHFIAVNHKNPELVQYKYKLEGFDKDWIITGQKTEAVYSNLDHGRYTFKVMASNGEDVWTETPLTFSFRIKPPFWQTWWFYTLCFLAFAMAVYSYLKIRSAKIKIQISHERIKIQSAIITEKNREIFDSITYAKRIQEAILPEKEVKNNLPNCFIFYKPKDIVSGDFYWYKTINNKHLIAAVDCTGHGVPGGFVSMVGSSGLNRAIDEYGLSKPADILQKLSEFVVSSFHAEEEDGIKDGMDAAICSFNLEDGELEFSGANNPMYLIRKSDSPLVDWQGQPIESKETNGLHEIKGDRRPVGSYNYDIDFTNHQIKLEKGDCLYLFSDGFPDQFGGDKGKKFLYKNFKNLLIELQKVNFEKRSELLQLRFDEWKGKNEQIDDICIIGIQF